MFELKGLKVIQSILSEIPSYPGVYKMFGKNGILYIGKAKNLKSRVRSYLNFKDQSVKNQVMLQEVISLEYEVVQTEEEALTLESSLIKKNQPPFNILLKDDKSRPYIVISTSSKFPSLFKTRGKLIGEDKFFGPFMDSHILENIFNLVSKIFKIRTCSNIKFKTATRPCIEYQLKRCTAPCVNYISELDYQFNVSNAISFLSGNSARVMRILKLQMEQVSKDENFEKAIMLRDQMFKVAQFAKKNSIDFKNFNSVDAVLIYEIEGKIGIEVFIIRNGLGYGSTLFFPTKTEDEDLSSVMEFFLMRYYSENEIPEKIIINIPVSASVKKVLKNKVFFAKSGINKDLINFAMPNLKEKLQKKVDAKFNISKSLIELQNLLDLTSKIKRIEIYDNSHTNGSFMLGAMVVFCDGEFDSKEYRKFNAKFEHTKAGDDYGMLKEMLKRRFTNEKMKLVIPDLLIIDGGKGQFSACLEVFKELNLDIPFICMAKGKNRNAGREWFYYKDKEFQLRVNSSLLYFLQNLRDEAHRFAITSHRKRREKF